MSVLNKFPQHIQELYQDGEKYRDELLTLLDRWPMGEYSRRIEFATLDESATVHESFQSAVSESLLNLERWINSLSVQVLPRTVRTKEELVDIFKRLKSAVLEEDDISTSKYDVEKAVGEALSLILSIPLPRNINQSGHQRQQRTPIPDTAFIMMSMNPSQPEFEDVCNGIKEVCQRFGIRALRADDIQHQEQITEVVLQYIDNSEFLIADLTGERPNVYYEIGYAHAHNKRPILFRKQDTNLHFDLSVHNVPEYKNVTELKKLLHDRLEAMLGRKAA